MADLSKQRDNTHHDGTTNVAAPDKHIVSGNLDQHNWHVRQAINSPVFGGTNVVNWDPQIDMWNHWTLKLNVVGGNGASPAADAMIDYFGDYAISQLEFLVGSVNYINYQNTNYQIPWRILHERREQSLGLDELAFRNRSLAERHAVYDQLSWDCYIDMSPLLWFLADIGPDGIVENSKGLYISGMKSFTLKITLRATTELFVGAAAPAINTMELVQRGKNFDAGLSQALKQERYDVMPGPGFSQSPGLVLGHVDFHEYQQWSIGAAATTFQQVLDQFTGNVSYFLIFMYLDSTRAAANANDPSSFLQITDFRISWAGVDLIPLEDEAELRNIIMPRQFQHSKSGAFVYVLSFTEHPQHVNINDIADGGHLDHDKIERPTLHLNFTAPGAAATLEVWNIKQGYSKYVERGGQRYIERCSIQKQPRT